MAVAHSLKVIRSVRDTLVLLFSYAVDIKIRRGALKMCTKVGAFCGGDSPICLIFLFRFQTCAWGGSRYDLQALK